MYPVQNYGANTAYTGLSGARITNADELCNIVPWLRHEDERITANAA